MKSEKIKYLLDKKGITQADIARDLNVSSSAVSLVIKKNSKSQKIQRHISHVLCIHHENVWGE